MPLTSIADLNRPAEEIGPLIEVAKDLSNLYDDFVVLEQEDGSKRAPGIHASELYPCLRKAVYSLTGVEKRPNVPKFWRQRFQVGHAVHGMLQRDFTALARRSARGDVMRVAQELAAQMNYRVTFEDEVPVRPDLQQLAAHYNIHASCDGVFTFWWTDPATGNSVAVLRVGLEIKTEAPEGYSKLTGPKLEHIRQVHIYMACLDLPLMWFFYMNKGNQNNTPSTSPFLITWQPHVWEEVEARMKTVHEFAGNGQLPERTEFVGCEFCPWSYTCQPSNLKTYQRNTPRRDVFRIPGV